MALHVCVYAAVSTASAVCGKEEQTKMYTELNGCIQMLKAEVMLAAGWLLRLAGWLLACLVNGAENRLTFAHSLIQL